MFKQIRDNLPERLASAAIFAMAFSVIGFFVPKTYLTYFDKTTYYKIYSPVAIDQSIPHFACDPVEVTFTKESLIATKGTASIALNLIKTDKNNQKTRVGFQERSVPLTKGVAIVSTTWDVGCSVPPGSYAFEGVLTYQLNGVQKEQSFYSEQFNISRKIITK